MYTDEGDRLVQALGDELVAMLRSGVPAEQVVERFQTGKDEIAAKGHPEVSDTEPRAYLRYRIRSAASDIEARANEVARRVW
jgi:hypothetical protein